jgi:hypothetical protein
MPFPKIPGPALAGFADLFDGQRSAQPIVGGGAGNLQAAKPTPSKPWQRTNIDKAKAATMHPRHNITALNKSLAKVTSVVNKAIASLKKNPTNPPTAAAVRAAKVAGVMLGAAVASGKPITPKQRTAIAKADAALRKAQAAADALRASATKALAAGKSAQAMTKALTAPKKVSVRGYTDNLLGYRRIGDDTLPVDDGTGTDPGAGDTGTPPADIPVAPAPPLSQPVNTPVPPDGIKYTGPIGRYDVGSYWYFYGPNRRNTDRPADGSESGMTGFVWGWKHANWPNDNLSPRWILRKGNEGLGNDSWDDGFGNRDDPNAISDAGTTASVSALSLQGTGQNGISGLSEWQNKLGVPPWGPLVGNPNRPNTKNLRWSIPDQCWFWYLEEAPADIAAPFKYAAAKAKQAAADADKAAADAAAKQAAKDAADAAAAQAAQDAQNALAENAEASAAKVAESQQATQQAQIDLDTQKQALAERQAALADQQQAQAAQAAQAQAAPADGGYGGGGGGDDYGQGDDEGGSANDDTAQPANDGSDDDSAQDGVEGYADEEEAVRAVLGIDEWGNSDI